MPANLPFTILFYFILLVQILVLPREQSKAIKHFRSLVFKLKRMLSN